MVAFVTRPSAATERRRPAELHVPPRPVDHAATTIDVALTDEEIEARLREIRPAERPIPYQRGVLAKYARLVSSASLGAITH